jgi:hypothetical protein
MDFVSIGVSAILSAALFILLEFSVILPLFKKIVEKSVNDTVTNHLVPTISNYIDTKIDDLTSTITKSIFVKIRGMFGGNKKGVNAILNRLADGEDLEDFENEYEPSTIDKVLDVLSAASRYLPNPNNGGYVNGSKEKEIVQKDENSIQDEGSPSQAFKKINVERID